MAMKQKFRKRPVVIEAIQFDGQNYGEMLHFIGESMGKVADSPHRKLLINTLEGIMTADEGDWIIKGIKNEFYPCKNDVFEKTYELVVEEAPKKESTDEKPAVVAGA